MALLCRIGTTLQAMVVRNCPVCRFPLTTPPVPDRESGALHIVCSDGCGEYTIPVGLIPQLETWRGLAFDAARMCVRRKLQQAGGRVDATVLARCLISTKAPDPQ
jgi:hypothetical protein